MQVLYYDCGLWYFFGVLPLYLLCVFKLTELMLITVCVHQFVCLFDQFLLRVKIPHLINRIGGKVRLG